MPRLLLPVLAAFLLGAAAPASAQVLSGAKEDPAERAGDPGRDIQSVSSSFDPAGTWSVAVRFYGVPTVETKALMRAHLAERQADGTCAKPSNLPILIAAWSNPEDKGGIGTMEGRSTNLVKHVDADQKGFRIEFTDSRLAGRAVCGLDTTTLSYKQPFDSVPAFEFPGAPTEAPAPPPPGDPAADATAPTAQMRILTDAKSARRGIVRVSLLAATEPATATVRLFGRSAVKQIAPGQDVRFALRLDRRRLQRLERKGRLAIRVVTLLRDAAGNTATLQAAATLRYRR